jgi:gluconate 2-dehydrogenase alpha chain
MTEGPTGRTARAGAIRLPEVDAVVVGVGWAGGILCAELARAGLSVVGLERGPHRRPPDTAFTRKHDELRFRVRHDLMQDPGPETWTFRHDRREAALPIRRLGAFLPGTGIGGAGGHFGGNTARFAPWEFEARSRTLARYGATSIPDGCTIQDWGITYEDLEPDYDRFERMAGVTGQAGNVGGEIREGGNPFEGPRSGEYPLPSHPLSTAGETFAKACRSLGYHPYPAPRSILSADYTNPDGVSRRACVYCGDCTHYTCAVDARADARVTVLPVAQRSPRFALRAGAAAVRVLHDGRRATGVLYRDGSGALFEQPAGMVALAAYTFSNVRLLLLSGMGRPYEPETGEGVVGRNYSYNCHAHGTAFFTDRRFRSYMGTSGATFAVADMAADNFDHTGAGFIGGITIQGGGSGGSPITGLGVPPGTPSWGAGWRRAIRDWYDRSTPVSAIGNVLAYRDNHLDLDPTYRDAWGDPLLRITFDWHENEHAISAFGAARLREVLAAMRPAAYTAHADSAHFDTVPYQGTHNTGGAIMGADPDTSVVDGRLRMWDHPNVWVVGGSALPQNGTPGPTATICALAYRAARAMVAEAGLAPLAAS